jgi:hypothetical protein
MAVMGGIDVGGRILSVERARRNGPHGKTPGQYLGVDRIVKERYAGLKRDRYGERDSRDADLYGGGDRGGFRGRDDRFGSDRGGFRPRGSYDGRRDGGGGNYRGGDGGHRVGGFDGSRDAAFDDHSRYAPRSRYSPERGGYVARGGDRRDDRGGRGSQRGAPLDRREYRGYIPDRRGPPPPVNGDGYGRSDRR